MAIAMFGGVVSKAGQMIGSTNEQMVAQGPVFSTADVLATLLDVLGIDPAERIPGTPITEVFA